MYFLAVGALTHVSTESKASVCYIWRHSANSTGLSRPLNQPQPSPTLSHAAQLRLLPFRTEIQISHTSKNTEWVFLNIPVTGLCALAIHDVKGKEMVSEFHISAPSMDTQMLLLCFFIKPTHQDVVLKHQFFSRWNVKWSFPKHATVIPWMGKHQDGEIRQLLAASMHWSRNRLTQNLRGLSHHSSAVISDHNLSV